MITPSQMRRKDESQATGRTLARQRADLRAAPRTQIAALRQFRMTCAETGNRLDDPRRKPHHKQARSGMFLGPSDRRRGDRHHQLAEMLLVQRDAVDAVVAVVRLGAKLATDGHLRGQADDADPDLVCHEGADGLVDVAGVGTQESAEYDQGFASAVGRSVAVPISIDIHSKYELRISYNRAALAISSAFCRLG